jgi:hypothetical protein
MFVKIPPAFLMKAASLPLQMSGSVSSPESDRYQSSATVHAALLERSVSLHSTVS